MTEPVDYSRIAEQYATHRHIHPEVFRRLAAAVSPETRVLEVGCGTGNYIAAIRAHAGCHAAGIDPSAAMLAKLRSRDPTVRAIRCRAEDLALAPARFDLVFSVDVIHHIRDRARAFREAFRVLRGGGTICTVTDSDRIIRSREPLATYFPETVEIELARYPRMDVLRAELRAAGFEAFREEVVEHAYELTDSGPYREKTHSSLLCIDEAAFRRGLARLETDLAKGPIRCTSRYAMLWATKPATDRGLVGHPPPRHVQPPRRPHAA